MRVAHIFNSFSYGGIETVFLSLLRNTPQTTSHVAVIFTQAADPGEARIPECVPVYRCPYRRRRRISLILRLARLLRDISADAVLSWSFGNHWMAAMAAWGAGVRTVYVSVHADPHRDRETRTKSCIAAHLARPFSSGEIACSKAVAKALMSGLRLPRQRVIAIPNGCEAEVIAERARRSRSLERRAGLIRVISVSRMDDAKDQPTLLRAVQALRAAGVPVELRMVGDGPRRADLEALAADLGIGGAVKFLGYRSDVPELLGRCDVFVHCTHTEGLPLVLLEAMAAGVPIVATDLPSCREVLDGGRCGLLVPPQDASAVAQAIRRLVEDEQLKLRLVETAEKRVRAEYDSKAQARRYLDLLAGPRNSRTA